MIIANRSIHIIDYENNRILSRDIPATFDEYVGELIEHINRNDSVRDYKTRSRYTEVISGAIAISSQKDNADVVRERTNSIANRLLVKEVEAQGHIGRLNTNVQKGSLIQALLLDDPVDIDAAKVADIREKILQLPEKKGFDRQFNSAPKTINARIRKTYEVNDGIQLKITDAIENLNETIVGDLKKNLIAIFGFLFTVILANIVSDQPLQNIFTREITVILEVVIAGSIIYLLICHIESQYKLCKIKRTYYLLKDNYKDLLSDVDLQESFNEDKMITDTVRSVKRGIWIYTIIWFVLLVGLLFILENTSSSPVITTWINDVVSFFHEIEKSGAH